MSPVVEINNKFETLIQRLPFGWEELAIEKQAFTRARQIKSAKDLLRAVFCYSIADYSLREVAAVLTREGKWMSDQAVHSRLTKCVSWLESLLSEMLFDKANWSRVSERGLKIVDATVLNCPAAVGTDYRLHLCYEAISQSSCGVKLTDVKQAERFTQFEYSESDIVLGDRIYGKAKHIIKVKESGADVVVRVSLQQLRLYRSSGEIIDWKEALIKAKVDGRLFLCGYVQDEKGNETLVYIHGKRLSEEEIEKAHRKVKKGAYDKGHKTREATFLLCEWIIVLTTIGPEELSVEHIFELYGVRWQIELYIKRLKSILKLGKIRAKRGSMLAKVHILAKMLYALLLETMAADNLGRKWVQMTGERHGTWFRVWKMMLDEFIESVIESRDWQNSSWRLLLRVLSERRRKRKLQRLSKQLIRWLDESALSESVKAANRPSFLQLAA